MVVDKDDNIKTYTWFERPDHSVSELRVSEYLGQRINQSGTLPLQGLLPKGVLPARAFRVTSNDGTCSHVVLTWALSLEVEGSPNAWYGLYVFDQPPGAHIARRTYFAANINFNLSYVLVRDLGGGGLAEIIDIGYEAQGETANIRQLRRDGSVQLLQRIDSNYITFVGDRDTYSYALRLEDPWPADKQLKPDEPCSVVRVLKWMPEEDRFIESRGGWPGL